MREQVLHSKRHMLGAWGLRGGQGPWRCEVAGRGEAGLGRLGSGSEEEEPGWGVSTGSAFPGRPAVWEDELMWLEPRASRGCGGGGELGRVEATVETSAPFSEFGRESAEIA